MSSASRRWSGAGAGQGPDRAQRRLDRLSSALSLDLDRARGWVLAQTVAWALGDDGVDLEQIEVAGWFLP